MNKIKDKKIIVLIIILIVFSISYFIVINKISYAFENDYDLNGAYNQKIEIITKCAEAYGLNNVANFNEEGLMYITVQNLIDEGYLFPDESGKIQNYLDNSETLNNKKIRIKKDNDKFIAEIYS